MTPERMKALREGGMTYAEIASYAGLNPGHVWAIINRDQNRKSTNRNALQRKLRGDRSVWEWWQTEKRRYSDAR